MNYEAFPPPYQPVFISSIDAAIILNSKTVEEALLLLREIAWSQFKSIRHHDYDNKLRG